MQFTYRNPIRSTDPSMAVAGARSIIVGARSYALDAAAPPDVASGRVARYAWVDHYRPLREGLWAMARHLRTLGHKAVAFADDNSIVDREAAYLGGLGWFGKNANLLLPKSGSLFVLGCVITTAELPPREIPSGSILSTLTAKTISSPRSSSFRRVVRSIFASMRRMSFTASRSPRVPELHFLDDGQ